MLTNFLKLKKVKLIKLLVNSEKEKKSIVEGSNYLANLKGLDKKLEGVIFLTSLYKNPGDIEIVEGSGGIQIKPFSEEKKVKNKLEKMCL